MKKFFSVVMSVMLVFSMVIPSFAHERKTILFSKGKSIYTVNGKEMDMGMAPMEIEGELMVPVQFISQMFDEMKPNWDQNTKTVTLNFWEGWLVIKGDFKEQKMFYIKNKKEPVAIPSKPVMINGRVFFPVNLIAQLSEMDYSWDKESNAAKLRDYHWMSYPAFSNDFKIVSLGGEKDKITQGTWLLVYFKDTTLDGFGMRSIDGKDIHEEDDNYPQYLKDLNKQFVEKGVDKMIPIEGKEKESEIVIQLIKEALKRKEGLREEFAFSYEDSKPLKNGEYFSKHHGFYPQQEFEIKTVIKNGRIDNVEILKYSDDSYVKEEFDKHHFLEKFKGQKSPKVDVISEATFSSKGIMKAVEATLKQAQK